MPDLMADAMSGLWADSLPKPKKVVKSVQSTPKVVYRPQPRVVYVQQKPVVKKKKKVVAVNPYLKQVRDQRMIFEEKRRLAQAREQYKPYRFSRAKSNIGDVVAGASYVGKGTGVVAKKTYGVVSSGVGKIANKINNKPETINQYRGSLYKKSFFDRLRGR